MWNKRKEEEYPPKPASTPASPANVQREAQPGMSTSHSPGFHAQDRGTAVIGRSVTIKGQIFSREDLTVDGEVEGSIELQENRLTIGPNGKVHAGIKAREIVVLGTINGNVEASDKIEIRKDGKLVGDLKTSRIVIEDGAYFKGSIDIIKLEAKPAPAPTKPVPAPATAPQAAASFAAPGTGTPSSASSTAGPAAKPAGR
ncbi:MAG: bactofilin family protein [Bryobacteraceae bacterium]